MHVVVTVNFSPWSPYSGGGQRSAHHLAAALVDLGHRVTVIYSRAPLETFGLPPRLPYDVNWAWMPALRSHRRALLRPAAAVSVARCVARELDRGATIVHGNGEEVALVPRLKRRHGFGLVVTPRYPSYPAGLARGGLSRAITNVAKPRVAALGWALRRADACCPTSQASAADICRSFAIDPSRVHVVPNGVDPEFSRVVRQAAAAAGPIVFYGRLEHQKGVFDLVDAYASSGVDRRLLVYGRGTARSRLVAKIARLGLEHRVVLGGWAQPEAMAEVLSQAALVVVPSWEESFGNVIAEAMTVGVPVIATRVGSIPELLEHERTGWLVPARNPQALASAISVALAAPSRAETMAREASRLARERFSWEASARAFAALYAKLPST